MNNNKIVEIQSGPIGKRKVESFAPAHPYFSDLRELDNTVELGRFNGLCVCEGC